MKERLMKKMFGSIVSLRDYEVADYVKSGGVVITYKGQKMTLTAEDLISKQFKTNRTVFRSKVPGWVNPVTKMPSYSIVDYAWNPDLKPVEATGAKPFAFVIPKQDKDLFGMAS